MITNLFNDKNFFRTMLTLSMPIIIQNLITFSLGAVDMLMIGQLGDKPVAAVGLADQIFFLMILMMFGISSGAATAIYLRGSSQDHESRLDDRTRRFVQLPRSPRWTPEDRTFRVGRAMRDTELPKMPAQPPSLPAKITE